VRVGAREGAIRSSTRPPSWPPIRASRPSHRSYCGSVGVQRPHGGSRRDQTFHQTVHSTSDSGLPALPLKPLWERRLSTVAWRVEVRSDFPADRPPDSPLDIGFGPPSPPTEAIVGALAFNSRMAGRGAIRPSTRQSTRHRIRASRPSHGRHSRRRCDSYPNLRSKHRAPRASFVVATIPGCTVGLLFDG